MYYNNHINPLSWPFIPLDPATVNSPILVVEQAQFRICQDNAVLVARLDDNLVVIRAQWSSNVTNTALKQQQQQQMISPSSKWCLEANLFHCCYVPEKLYQRCP